MDDNKMAVQAVDQSAPIGAKQLREWTLALQKYKSGKVRTENRVIAAENWWKLRNAAEESRTTDIGADKGFVSQSGWLHNVISNKHADAMEAYPEPNLLPREEGDRGEATVLTSVIPCILEQNHFEDTYSEVAWQKTKTGTGIYKVVWDKHKHNGLGDIAIDKVSLLNVFWEPGVTDIQRSKMFFHTELRDKDELKAVYPQLESKLRGKSFMAARFLYDDTVDTDDKATVIDVYYHKHVNGKRTLQYCQYVEDVVLYATENDPTLAERGLYDHGLYPYVFDPMFPIEGSPCGYGLVDLCRNPQTEIDLLKTSFLKNSIAGSTPRYFARVDGAVNEEEFLDLSRAIVHVNGNLGDDTLQPIQHSSLDGNYISMLDHTIQELRETSGNTETASGATPSGITAASAIAALQEASGKNSRDSTRGSYRAFGKLVEFCVELIRQFYDLPRQFRIIGQYGAEQYVTYSNAGIRPQPQGTQYGVDLGFRLPQFDIKISAQKKNAYTKVAQNELALQLYDKGFFNPQNVDMALMCLDIMDFDGKDTIIQKVAKQGTMYQKLMQYQQLALMLASQYAPHMVQGLSNDIMSGMGVPAANGAGSTMYASDQLTGASSSEHALVEGARERSAQASQPEV